MNEEYEYPEPGLKVLLEDVLGKGHEADAAWWAVRKYLLEECRLWEGPAGDWYLLEPSIIGADK